MHLKQREAKERSYLEQKLYKNSATTFSIFRSLNNLERQFVIRLINLEKIQRAVFTNYWIDTNQESNLKAGESALRQLESMGLIKEVNDAKGCIQINPDFKNTMLDIWIKGFTQSSNNEIYELF